MQNNHKVLNETVIVQIIAGTSNNKSHNLICVKILNMSTELSRRVLLKAAALSLLPATPDAQNSIEAKGNVPTTESLVCTIH